MGLQAELITSPQAMCVADDKGFITHSNAAHTRMVQAGNRPVTGLNWRELAAEADWPRLERLEALAFAGRPIGYEVKIRHPSGIIIPSSVNVFRVASDSGVFVINTVRPLTFQERVQQCKRRDITAYIAELSRELADMAEQNNLDVLGRHLREAAWMAGDALERLADMEDTNPSAL